jgi:Leucine-rich repeat (LRR) protein
MRTIGVLNAWWWGVALLSLLVVVIQCGAVLVPMSDDILGLMAFKAGVQDPHGVLESWQEDDASPCNWTGVACDDVTGRVTDLTLVGLSLGGQIGRGFVKLAELQTVTLAYNNFSGSIDTEVAQLLMLSTFNVSNNALSGAIPSFFTSGSSGSLTTLDLSNNLLSWAMPDAFFINCQNLVFLSLAHNILNGSIPSSLSSCVQLTHLNLAANQFSGDIPMGIGQLSKINSIDISQNFLSGLIPGEIGSLQNLTSLSLMGNKFTGSIPSGLFSCSSLVAIDFSKNSFTGTLPVQLQNLSSLTLINAGSNMLSGGIPTWLGSLSRLQVLDLSENQFSGLVPASLGQLYVLQELDLSGNLLSGSIPVELGACTQLRILDLSHNNLSGDIPSQLLAPNIQFLALSGNSLTGSIPSISSGNCTFLQFLDISGNRLEGPIPGQLVQCSNLVAVNLSANSLSLQIPWELGSLPFLVYLDLSRNFINGSIPPPLGNAAHLNVLDLHQNMLSGPIPSEIGNCSALLNLNLAMNRLSGQIPVDLTNLSLLEFLDLSSNNLSGEIPPGFQLLRSLVMVNVSNNQLSGPIPTQGVFVNASAPEVSGNDGLCGKLVGVACPPGPSKPIVLNPGGPSSGNPVTHGKGSRIVLSISAIIAISAAAVIAIGVIVVTLLNIRAQTRPQHTTMGTIESVPQSPLTEHLALGKLVMFRQSRKLSGSDWMAGSAQALLNKQHEIGRGGFGTVYKATLPDGHMVAVKKLLVASLVKGQDDFEREVGLLGIVKHQNLVALQGYYWTPQLQLLVYDFISNGNLYRRLHELGDGEPPLTWDDRFKIASGIALGLAHLHHGCRPQVIHYDLKSSNVLLTQDNEACISDYGLAKLLPVLDSYVMSSRFQSALGYMAPEFACSSLKITEKCDVYGFGVLLLELVTGRRPVEYMEDDVVILCDHIRALLEEGHPLSCVDLSLHGYPDDEVLPVIKLGLICTSHVPSNRPSMAEVVQILELIRPIVDAQDFQ